MLDAIRILAALFLIFFLPGYLLVQALFPRKDELDLDFDWLYRLALGIGLSIVLTILVGFGLNSLGVNEETGMGYVTAGPITLSLVALSLVLFLIAWFRGAFPFMGRLHPALIRFPPRDPRIGDIPYIKDKRKRFEHQQLTDRKFKLVKAISDTEGLAGSHSGQQRRYYDDRKKRLLDELALVEKDIDDLDTSIREESVEPEEIDGQDHSIWDEIEDQGNSIGEGSLEPEENEHEE